MKTNYKVKDTIRVLYVDDDVSQLSLMKELLPIYEPEITVEIVPNPLDVAQRMRKNRYDCLLFDYKMPKLNGIELATQIRKESKIPIILYTGQGSEEVAEKAFEVGINDYFRKEPNQEHIQVLAKKIREIAEKRRIEQVYSSVVKDSRDAIIIIVGENLAFYNQAFMGLTGATNIKRIKNTSYFSFFPDNEAKQLNKDMKSLLQGKEQFIISDYKIRKGKRTIPVEINITPIDYLGEKAFLCIIRDLSERIKLEKSIRRSEIRYRSLLELAPDGIMTINMHGTVTWINPAYTQITGFNEEEIVGKKAWSIKTVKSGDAGTFFRAFFDLIKGNNVPPIEFQWVNKAGETGWGEGRASLLKIENRPTEVLVILRDITDSKKLENDLKSYNHELEVLANERAKQLLESEQMVAVGTIASTVSHDLRGPLSAIRNALYLMDRSPDKTPEMKQTISKAVDNAVKMLDEVRARTSESELETEMLELSSFIKTIVDETPIPSRITVKTDLKMVNVSIDGLRVRRVLENLISNAVDAMNNEGKLIISNGIEGDQVCIIVQDTGTGIPENIKKTLFRPFVTTKNKGTGLGLYYCKKTIEKHNGSITVDSKSGSGSTFTIYIPLHQPIDATLEQPIVPPQIETET